MRVYYTTSNNGDGSASVHFFDSKECITYLEDKDPETWGMGEGGSYFDVEGSVTEITISTLDQVKSEDF